MTPAIIIRNPRSFFDVNLIDFNLCSVIMVTIVLTLLAIAGPILILAFPRFKLNTDRRILLKWV